MKTILRIIVILLVASIVAGGFFIALQDSSMTTSLDKGRQPPAMTITDGQTMQPMEGPDGGDHEVGTIVQGLSGLLVTLVKLAGITLLVLLLEKGLSQLRSLKANYSHQ